MANNYSADLGYLCLLGVIWLDFALTSFSTVGIVSLFIFPDLFFIVTHSYASVRLEQCLPIQSGVEEYSVGNMSLL